MNVVLIGFGMAGRLFHAPLIEATPGLHLAAIVTASPDRQAEARKLHPRAQILGSADLQGFDLAVIATPNRTHVSLALAALQHGLHVVVDKPFAPTAAEGRRLVAAARERRRLLTVFQNRRWDGDFLTLKRLLQEGALGRIQRFESRYERWRPALKGGWRELGDPQEAGGLLYDLGAHLVDQAVHLFGRPVRVYAEMDVRRGEVDDDVFVALTHSSGVRSHLWMSSMAAALGPRLRVLGSTAGYTKWGMDVQEAQLKGGLVPGSPGWGEEPEASWGIRTAGAEVRPVPTQPGAYQRFYEKVAQGAAPVDPAEAVLVLEVLEAARRSAGSGEVVVLD